MPESRFYVLGPGAKIYAAPIFRSPIDATRLPTVGYTIFRYDELEFRPPSRGNQERGLAPLSEALQNMRANIWRMPPGVRGARHLEHAQDEMFVVLDGTATMLLGDPPERVELPRGSIVAVETETALQLRNESDAETTVLIVGAPPETGKADYLPEVD
jgi:uncharacterized cupin superfamily protein